MGLGGALARDLVGRSDYLVTGLIVASLQAAAGIAQLIWNLRAGPDRWRRGMNMGVALLVPGLVIASLALEWRSVPGLVLGALVTGLGQGLMWRAYDSLGFLQYSFVETVEAMKPFYMIRATGGLLFLIGTTLVAQNAPAEVRGQVFAALYLVAYTALGVPAVLAALAAGWIGLIPAYHLLAVIVGGISVVAVGVVGFGRRRR